MKQSIKNIYTLLVLGIFINSPSSLYADDQLFGGSKDKDSESNEKAEQLMVKDESPVKKLPKVSTPINRNKIESVIPVKRLPDGWVFRDELLAPWATSLPAVLTIVPDSTVEVVYTDESRTTKDGIVLPIKRATVEFN